MARPLRQPPLAQAASSRFRRSDAEYSLWDVSAEALIFLRVLQEFDNLDQLLLGLIDALYIFERHAGLVLDVDFRFALTDLHDATTGTHSFKQPTPEKKKKDDRDDPRKYGGNPVIGNLASEWNAAFSRSAINSGSSTRTREGYGFLASLYSSSKDLRRSAGIASFIPSGLISP